MRVIIFLLFLSLFFFLSTNIFFLAFLILAISIIIETLRVNSSISTLGFPFNKSTFFYIFIGFISPFILFILIAVLSQLSSGFRIFKIVDDFNPNFFSGIALILLASALIEELIFRGIPFQASVQRFGKNFSVLLFSIFFVLAHLIFNSDTLDLLFILNIFLANILLSLMYLRTGTLWLPLSFHYFWNLFQASILGSPVSSFDFGIEFFETNIDTVGILAFNEQIGFEGSILCSVVAIVFSVVVIRTFNLLSYLKSIFFLRAYRESIISEKLLHKLK